MDAADSKKRSRDSETCIHRRTRPKLATSVSNEAVVDVHSAPRAASTSDASDPSDIDGDSSSELSESSDEPSSESSSDEASENSDDEDDADHESQAADGRDDEVVNLRANRGEKPQIKFNKEELGPDIRDFLKDFLPQLKAANEELEAERQAGKLEHRKIESEGDDEGEYIEMNLGLGVLEEKDDAASESSESDSNEDPETEKDIMGKLLGRKEKPSGTHIQEVEEVEDG